MTSPDNKAEGTPLAFIYDDTGAVVLFRKYEGHLLYPKYIKMLTDPDRFKAKGVEYKFEAHCRRCNRLLTNPASIDLGLGPDCAAIVYGTGVK